MKYDAENRKVTFDLNEYFDVFRVNYARDKTPGNRILVEVQNTKGITSSMIRSLERGVAIRVAGGYDSNRVNWGKDITYSNGEKGTYYYNAVIYQRSELVKILEEIEKIESGINKNWSDIQKAVYVYDELKKSIMYDPKYEYKYSKEIRSLRGLVTKETVCAGFSLIFKEIMDRNNIDCEYVEGIARGRNGDEGGHAWNILNIENRKYPIDLTWDNSRFRSGSMNSHEFLGANIKEFSESHIPNADEKTQDYIHTLSQIDPNVLMKIRKYSGINRVNNYDSTTQYVTRSDGSRYMLSQIGDNIINNTHYYRYYYADIYPNGHKALPYILYSDTSMLRVIDTKKFGGEIPPNYEEAVFNILFSKNNILDSISRGTYYIGKVNKSNDPNKVDVISSYEDIKKPDDKSEMFALPTKRFLRSDGSVFIAQKMGNFNLIGYNLNHYDIFEIVNENGKETLKKNTVYTEKDFFNDNRQSLVDDYLSRERIDRKVNEAGGYIGYYSEHGIRTYNPKLVEEFKTSKYLGIDTFMTKERELENMLKQNADNIQSRNRSMSMTRTPSINAESNSNGGFVNIMYIIAMMGISFISVAAIVSLLLKIVI